MISSGNECTDYAFSEEYVGYYNAFNTPVAIGEPRLRGA